MRMTRMVRAPAATPTMMVRFWELMGSVLGSVKDKVTLLSAMPPELRATQEYCPRSLEVTEVTVRLKFLSIPPSQFACQNMPSVCWLYIDSGFCYAKFMFTGSEIKSLWYKHKTSRAVF